MENNILIKKGSDMISTDCVTTLNISSDKIKTFFFNRVNIKNPEEKARKFCRDNKMKYLGVNVAEPYSLHTWQHNEAVTFDVECSSKTNIYFYQYGKF